MGLSTKQVSSDDHWSQQNLSQAGNVELPKPPLLRQQQEEKVPLKCPRCGSTNTKFCYYNNYNKSQRRHLCKACKRHWTKGGVLRDVPVGGSTKNKRLKKSNATSTKNRCSSSSSTANLFLDDQNNTSDVLFQALIHPPSLQHDEINTINSFSGKCLVNNNCSSMGSTLLAPENEELQFSFSNVISSSDVNDPCSLPTKFQSSDGNNFTENLGPVVDSTISSIMPTTSSIAIQPWWQFPSTSGVMDMTSSCWNWHDMDSTDFS